MNDLITRLVADPRFMEAGGAALTGIVLAAAAGAFALRRNEKTAITFTIVALGFFVWGGVLWAVQRGDQWRWILGSLPALIILNHAVFLFMIRRRVVPSATGKARDVLLKRPETAFLADVLEQASQASTRHFGLAALLLRYLLPALFVGGVGIGVSGVLANPETASALRLPHDAVLGAKLGLAGAYVYVLLYLGRRSFQQDITAGAATWSAVTLAAGPLLATVLGVVSAGRDSAFAGPSIGALPEGGEGSRSGTMTLLFFAGFSPRLVVSFIEGIVHRIYLSRVLPAGIPARTVPIGQIRGVTREVAERLSEQGIEDAFCLARADPIGLLRNTCFDRRQIVGWIDNAILVTTLPEAWQALEKVGIGGAIDLAWHASPHHAQPLKAEDPGADEIPPRVLRLAEIAKVDAHVLSDVIERLRQDAQVLLIWCLYQIESGEGDPEVEESARQGRVDEDAEAA